MEIKIEKEIENQTSATLNVFFLFVFFVLFKTKYRMWVEAIQRQKHEQI